MVLKGMWIKPVGWIHLVQDMIHWWEFVNVARNLQTASVV
jgi:hypothetical protein